MIPKITLLACLVCFAFILPAQLSGQQLVADINQTPIGSDPRGLKTAPESLVFLANSLEFGTELFQSDGTVAGTHLLFDLEPGATDGHYAYYSVIGNAVYALTYDVNYVRSIWKIDLATQTPVLLQTVATNTAYYSSFEEVFTAVGDKVFFTIRNSNSSFELWKTDGTPGGTIPVRGLGSSAFPDEFTVLNEILYFIMDDGIHGRELWRSDGTTAGTYLVKDIDQQNTGSGLFNLTVFQGKIYFIATEQTYYYEVWTSDGTEAGTQLFADLSPNGITSAPTELTVAGDKLFFTAMPEMQPGHKLWVTDGTPQNTQVVSNVEASKLRAVNGKLFFIGTDSINGSELWTSDGTGAGTFLVADIRPGSASGINNQSLITGTDGNNMYFVALDSLHGSELWKTTGVPGNAVLVKDIFPGIYASDIRGIAGLNGLVLFTATDNLVGRELFISDGSFAGTNSITALRPTNLGSLFYYNLPIFQVFQDKLFFNANNGLNGEEPWSSDGTTTGTALLLDIYSGLESSDPFFKAATASDLFFSANSAGFGREIWKTNGTTQGTVLLKDINPGPDGCSTEDIAALGDKIVFTAYRPVEQEEMWSSDGTEAGTNLLKDIAPGGPSQPRLLPQAFSLSGLPTALFSARPDSLSKGTLWKTDGSPSGTVELWSPDSSSIFTLNEAIQWGTEVLFTGFFPNGDVALYKTDGTSGGTGLVKAISTGLANGGQSQFTVFKNQVFFSANDGISGRELWRTDGTGPGTYRLNDLAGGNAGSYPMAFYNFKDTLLFFSATDEGYNSELWSTTGNAGDTHLVKDIRPGYQSSNLYDFVSYQGKVYFSADDGLHGRELWQTDGSLAGTTMVKDINPGLASSVPTDLTVFNDHIYFAADDGVHGRELWRFPEDSSSSTQAPVATGLTIYPNPVAQFLTLQLDSGGTRDVLVYDIAGRLAERFIVPGSGQQRLDVGRLSTGFYTLICTDQESHARLFARVQIVR